MKIRIRPSAHDLADFHSRRLMIEVTIADRVWNLGAWADTWAAERPYRCAEHGFTTSSPTSWNAHLRDRHRQEAPT